jgi:ABC-type branched-subunit amino acid transport system ATPase component
MSATGPILEFDGVTVLPTAHGASGVSEVSFCLNAGEIGLVEVEEGREQVPLADAAEGLVLADAGCVRFMGKPWSEMSAHRQADQRGRIRRVFQHYGWISNLDVMENICLAECHHTHRPEREIIEEARALALRIGVNEVPAVRPSRVHSLVLRKLEWVRALLGQPVMVILERPLLGAPRADAGLLIRAVIEEARRGAAVLWLTDEPVVCEYDGFERVKRFKMDGERLGVPAAEGAGTHESVV